MPGQVSCLRCAEEYIIAARAVARMREAMQSQSATFHHSWFCVEHGGFTVRLELRQDTTSRVRS